MNTAVRSLSPDKPFALLTLLGVLVLSLFLQHEFATRQALLFLIGLGLRFAANRAADDPGDRCPR